MSRVNFDLHDFFLQNSEIKSIFADNCFDIVSINKLLKSIGKDIGVDDLEFYAARHSWATIATNVAKVDKYTVHTALNHVDDAMKVTDIYIDKDYSIIADANKKVLNLLNWDKIKE